jgi:hypothetical protein
LLRRLLRPARPGPLCLHERLTEALSHPDDALYATDAIREVIDRIVITPGQQRGENHVTLQGDLATILEWIERAGKPCYKPATDIASSRLSVSVGLVPGIHVLLF